ncbi:hypothetical protein KFL_012960010 [Klebsormidium nitens]|uniref:B box-type domain-containing protein n=1 Tax=Klebsormidium nitens TaxID=105231 RepID=A0A1Y1IW20_KLENI|nr:hypothetical protein KFL_012960010 [Klebsormidium nitens]|eukprot:GAQ93096.1 hypothetical protein KFL_012960010 [Klebsormidium nitens]
MAASLSNAEQTGPIVAGQSSDKDAHVDQAVPGDESWPLQPAGPAEDCEACREGENPGIPAVWLCKDCELPLCGSCWEGLHRVGRNKAHERVVIEQPTIPCEGVEEDEPCIYRNAVEAYCSDCDQLLCGGCWKTLHGKGTRKCHCRLPVAEAERLREQALAAKGENKNGLCHFAEFNAAKASAWVVRASSLNKTQIGATKRSLVAFGFTVTKTAKSEAVGGAISQRYQKVMQGWSPKVSSEVTLIVGSEGPVPRQPEESSLHYDTETVRLYAQERFAIRQELGALKQGVTVTNGGKDGSHLDKVGALEGALKAAVKAGEAVEYGDHRRAIQRLRTALANDVLLLVAFQDRMKHLEPVAVYVRSPDFLRFAYEMVKESELLEAELFSLKQRLESVAEKIESQNEAAKAGLGRVAGRPAQAKTAAVGVQGSKAPGKKGRSSATSTAALAGAGGKEETSGPAGSAQQAGARGGETEARGGAGENDWVEILKGLSFGERELEGLDLKFAVEEAILSEGWCGAEVCCLVASVWVWQQRGLWQRFPIALCCEGVGVLKNRTAEELRRKWRELVAGRFRPAVFVENRYKQEMKVLADKSEKIGEGVYINRALEESVALDETIRVFEQLLEEVASTQQLWTAKKESVAEWAKPWARVAGDAAKLTVLLEISSAISLAESRFFSLSDAHTFAQQSYAEMDLRYPFQAKPSNLLDCLLRYLPIISVTVTVDSSEVQLCARPLQSDAFIRQFATLARQLQEKSQETRNRVRELPVQKYITFLDTEKDRRVFKGVVAQLTSPEFVQKEFGWRTGSVAAIVAELEGMATYLGSLDVLFRAATSSETPRRKKKAAARAELKATRFLLRKGAAGGRPSLLTKYSCCLGPLIERLLEELDYGGKAERRRQDASLHHGGRSSLDIIWPRVLQTPCCRTGDCIEISRATLHRAFNPARKRPPFALLFEVRPDEKEANVDAKYSHVAWRMHQDAGFSRACATLVAGDDHAKLKADVSTSTGKHRVFHIATNKKVAPDHDARSKTPDSNIIIDSIVRLSLDTRMNAERLEGRRAPLVHHGGKQVLVSRNGGVPFAVLQAEKYSPSTAAQKVNNLAQLRALDLEAWDRCSFSLFTDKGADRNPEFFEVILCELIFLQTFGLCYLSHVTHAGGLSAFNTAPERLNGEETLAICNVPIDSQAYGAAVDVSTGQVDADLVRKNLEHELDEVALRLENAEFCGRLLTVVKAAAMECGGKCVGACTCELGFINEEERLALRAFYKASARARATWEPARQRERFALLVGFLSCERHTLLTKYSLEFRACFDEACEFKCMDRFQNPRVTITTG